MESVSPILLQVLLGVPVLGGLVYYYALGREMAARGGRLNLQYFGLPDLLMGSVLALYFGLSGFLLIFKSETSSELKSEHLVTNFGFMLAVLLVVLFFAFMRRLPLLKAFHLSGDELASLPLRTGIALATALPPIWGVGFLWEHYLQNSQPEQSLVSLFRSSAESGDWSAVLLVVVSAFFQAPLVEEVLFRGYFYVTLKRYVGAITGALSVSALFAVCHGNIRAIPGLFVLSLCQTLTLERYGSLWICIAMHACYNGLSLLVLYMESQGWLPH